MSRTSSDRSTSSSHHADFLVSRPYSAWVLALLFGVAVLNMLDRQILGMLVVPIKAEFGVSDTAMGFLTGP
ncbi:MAG: hypothetical protein KDA28_15480, partial [Phycisphaerales bacterium]|nr:hypothetical protein [Phycisphaerales bacterium]